MDTRTGIKLGKAFLFRFHRRVNSKGVNGNCVTVVASTGLHFRVFHFLTSAASHDLKETIDTDYCFLQGLRGRFPVNKLNPKSPSYLKPMIHRSASFPQIQHGGQCTADILFRTMNGFFQGVSFCKIGGDCAG